MRLLRRRRVAAGTIVIVCEGWNTLHDGLKRWRCT